MNTSKLSAIAYLAKQKNYRIIHKGTEVILEHYAHYGYCSGGTYSIWEVVANYTFGEDNN